jgi:hypothetical protein
MITQILQELYEHESITMSKADGNLIVSFHKVIYEKNIQLRADKSISKYTLENAHDFERYLFVTIEDLRAEIYKNRD